MTRISHTSLPFIVALIAIIPSQCFAMTSVGILSKERATEFGITMHHRKCGNAEVKVWLEIKKTWFLDKFSYCELQMKDAKGKHLVSKRLQPRTVAQGQPEEIISFVISVSPSQLENCAFMIGAYDTNIGKVGYLMNVKDFLGTKEVTSIEYLVNQHNLLCRNGEYDKAMKVAELAFQLYPEHGASSALLSKSVVLRKSRGG